jgi:hypothetical protein
MAVTQSGCDFMAAFWNGDGTILHEITGKIGVNERMIAIRRAPGCTTQMYGNVFLGDSGLWWSIDGTSGGCGIDGHRETRLFEPSPTFEQAMARIPPILVEGGKQVTRRVMFDIAWREVNERISGKEVSGGGGKPAEMARDVPGPIR